MTRPELRRIPLSGVLPIGGRGEVVITMSFGQWDSLLAAAYDDGWVLLELDDDEQPAAAYQKIEGGAQITS